ncbi:MULTISPECIES: AraC family transcriptional regulator [Mycobacteriaceae]|uniref:AraC family transcriptional regulator n=1 Tax=Mycolicibacterium mucogenicum DSM 44124 TaxID=1226753 RepID=A0A8H2PJD0_MYCMU|nr:MULTISPECIES: AraC family transcriptional regulator [Mycobacteriaceae]KAB7752793.1 AraC family transcriptional regulator [Mycolicibacterium mucogenicum DSM 44124]QPG69135.1 AraC family transcriptional regulator ligand-binding domain-containing protein [Mycolicibacterium mucogenicum DSM 44124]SEA74393.1 AraC-type DNA-binding protein [Mycobacterium sp. 283mftsu]
MDVSSRMFVLTPAVRSLLTDLNVSVEAVLRRAHLPDDFFSRGTGELSSAQYFAFWSALEVESDRDALPVAVAGALSAESFDPPIFAALCSPNLITAAQRIAQFKPLIGPIAITVDRTGDGTTVSYTWQTSTPPPPVFVTVELLFWVALARLGTRRAVTPLRVQATQPPPPSATIRGYLGVDIEAGTNDAVVFSNADADLPFVTENAQMWSYFSPQLHARLSELPRSSSMTERVRTVLLEALPAGHGDIESVSRRLAVSPRTLQRQLQAEDTSFQAALSRTRESLARHYLTTGDTSVAQIALLVGYKDTSSFYRAYRGWTGTTPDATRLGATTGAALR